MVYPPQFEELAKKLLSALPVSVKEFEKELQQKFKEILQVAFSRLDLVNREEFDVQAKVLSRTREKLENLQAQVELLMKDKLPPTE